MPEMEWIVDAQKITTRFGGVGMGLVWGTEKAIKMFLFESDEK